MDERKSVLFLISDSQLLPNKKSMATKKVNFQLDKGKYIRIKWRYGYREINNATSAVSILPLIMNTGFTTTTKYWDKELKRVHLKGQDAGKINKELDKLEVNILQCIDRYALMNNNNLPSPSYICKHIDYTDIKRVAPVGTTPMIDFLNLKISQKQYAANSIKGFNQFINKFILFEEKIGRKIMIEELDEQLYSDFISFLISLPIKKTVNGKVVELSRSNNDLFRYKSVIKQILKWAEKENIKSKFEGYSDKGIISLKKRKSDSVYFDFEMISCLEKMDLSKRPGLIYSWHRMIIGLYTGLRVSDLLRVDNSHIINNSNSGNSGNYGKDLKIRQMKTGNFVRLPIKQQVVDSINYCSYHPQSLSEQKFRDNIKEISRLAGFDHLVEVLSDHSGKEGKTFNKKPFNECVSAHTLRRSLCTNLYSSGIPPQVICCISGHQDVESLLQYIKVENEMVYDRYYNPMKKILQA